MSSGLLFEDVAVGTEVPPYAVELILQRLVMEAGANRDFAPLHFDREAARAEGIQEVFANTMMLQTLFEVMLRQWMGAGGRIRRLGFRMRAMNYVDQTLSARGRVSRLDGGGERGTVEVEIWQETAAQGCTVSGTALVELPRRDAR